MSSDQIIDLVIDPAAQAQQVFANEFFDRQMRSNFPDYPADFFEENPRRFFPYSCIASGRFTDEQTVTVFGSFYFADFESEDEEVWPKLNYAYVWVRFASETADVLASGYEDGEDPQYPQLDLFHSDMQQEVAEWSLNLLDALGTERSLVYLGEHGLEISDIKDNRIRSYFQDDAPRCETCGRLLQNYRDEDNQFGGLGFGFGCADCCEPYCPLCFAKVEPPHCEHLIIDHLSASPFDADEVPDEVSPFDQLQLRESLTRYAHARDMSLSAWSYRQKQEAFGNLLPAFEAAEPLLLDDNDAILVFLEALPLVPGSQKFSYLFEWGAMTYSCAKGFFSDRPHEAHAYYSEHARLFVAGLNSLADTEPEDQRELSRTP